MPKIYAKCQKLVQKIWNFIFCHLDLVRAVYWLSFKVLVRSVASTTKILPHFLWFEGGLCYKHRRIRHGVEQYKPITNKMSKNKSRWPLCCNWKVSGSQANLPATANWAEAPMNSFPCICLHKSLLLFHESQRMEVLNAHVSMKC